VKTLNEPVSVIVRCLADGTVEPLVFRYLKKEYKVKSVKWWKFGRSVWSGRPSRLYCVCTDDDKIAELEWFSEIGVWQLIKM